MERAANRQKLTIKQAGNVRLHSSIAVGEDGILHVSHYNDTNGNLKYARCGFDCTKMPNWQRAVVRSAATPVDTPARLWSRRAGYT